MSYNNNNSNYHPQDQQYMNPPTNEHQYAQDTYQTADYAGYYHQYPPHHESHVPDPNYNSQEYEYDPRYYQHNEPHNQHHHMPQSQYQQHSTHQSHVSHSPPQQRSSHLQQQHPPAERYSHPQRPPPQQQQQQRPPVYQAERQTATYAIRIIGLKYKEAISAFRGEPFNTGEFIAQLKAFEKKNAELYLRQNNLQGYKDIMEKRREMLQKRYDFFVAMKKIHDHDLPLVEGYLTTIQRRFQVEQDPQKKERYRQTIERVINIKTKIQNPDKIDSNTNADTLKEVMNTVQSLKKMKSSEHETREYLHEMAKMRANHSRMIQDFISAHEIRASVEQNPEKRAHYQKIVDRFRMLEKHLNSKGIPEKRMNVISDLKKQIAQMQSHWPTVQKQLDQYRQRQQLRKQSQQQQLQQHHQQHSSKYTELQSHEHASGYFSNRHQENASSQHGYPNSQNQPHPQSQEHSYPPNQQQATATQTNPKQPYPSLSAHSRPHQQDIDTNRANMNSMGKGHGHQGPPHSVAPAPTRTPPPSNLPGLKTEGSKPMHPVAKQPQPHHQQPRHDPQSHHHQPQITQQPKITQPSASKKPPPSQHSTNVPAMLVQQQTQQPPFQHTHSTNLQQQQSPQQNSNPIHVQSQPSKVPTSAQFQKVGVKLEGKNLKRPPPENASAKPAKKIRGTSGVSAIEPVSEIAKPKEIPKPEQVADPAPILKEEKPQGKPPLDFGPGITSVMRSFVGSAKSMVSVNSSTNVSRMFTGWA